MCHLGYVTKSHWHNLSDTFSLSDTTLQRQKMCHSGYVHCISFQISQFQKPLIRDFTTHQKGSTYIAVFSLSSCIRLYPSILKFDPSLELDLFLWRRYYYLNYSRWYHIVVSDFYENFSCYTLKAHLHLFRHVFLLLPLSISVLVLNSLVS